MPETSYATAYAQYVTVFASFVWIACFIFWCISALLIAEFSKRESEQKKMAISDSFLLVVGAFCNTGKFASQFLNRNYRC